MGKIKKRRRQKIRDMTYFYTENSAKLKKNRQQKSLPPEKCGGTDFGFNLGIPHDMTYFYTENSAKFKKWAKNIPPNRGWPDFGFNLGVHPPAGG